MPIRILHIVNKMDRAGLETMIMNYYRHIDRNVIQFDFLVHRDEKGSFESEINMLGGNIYRTIAITPKKFFQYLRSLRKFFEEHPAYRVVHAHLDSLSYFALHESKRENVPVRIAHSHCNAFDINAKIALRFIAKQLIPFAATHFFACSKDAGAFMFGEEANICVLHNAIDINSFSFSADKREAERALLGCSENDFVIGHVGRFAKVKNHKFLIKIFEYVLRFEPEAKLVLAGKGPLEQATKAYVQKKGLSDHVCFVGEHKEIASLLNAFDLFVLPSKYEGLGICLIEAQANGLHCIAADTVSKESALTEQVEYLSLRLSATEWAKKLVQCKGILRTYPCDQIRNAGYDICEKAKWLEDFYCANQQ